MCSNFRGESREKCEPLFIWKSLVKTKWIRMEEIDENRLKVHNGMVGSVGNMVGHHAVEQGSDPPNTKKIYFPRFLMAI